MPTSVEINIRGLAVCYRDDVAWNIVFLCDVNHPLNLEDPEGDDTELHRDGKEFTCDFTAGILTRAPGPYPNGLFNLNGRQAHDGNLRYLRRNEFHVDLIHMRLPSSHVELKDHSGLDYWIQEVRTNPGKPDRVGPVAKKIAFTFEFDSEDISVIVGNRHDQVYNETFRARPGKTLKFHFNNHCRICSHNDSLDIYDIVIDGEEGNERRFVTGGVRDSDGNIPGHDPTRPTFDGQGFARSPPYGNCDPMGWDPPIGG